MNSETIERATAFADAFSLLAILTEFPTEELAAAASDGSLRCDIASICADLGVSEDEVQGAFGVAFGRGGEDLLAEARREYTRLFNHPEHPAIPIYEGQFLFRRGLAADWRTSSADASALGGGAPPRLFVNPASLDAEREYRAAGLAQVRSRAIPADAMPVETAFLSQLFLGYAEAVLAGDADAAQGAGSAIEEFRHYHTDKWMLAFFEACALESTCFLYRAAGLFGVAVAEAFETWGR